MSSIGNYKLSTSAEFIFPKETFNYNQLYNIALSADLSSDVIGCSLSVKSDTEKELLY